MLNLPPYVRLILTFVVATLATLTAMVDTETVRIVCAPLIAGFGAIGILPPQQK